MIRRRNNKKHDNGGRRQWWEVSLWVVSCGVVALAMVLAVLYVYDVGKFPFSFGLDLAGGTQVTYTADVSEVPDEEVSGADGDFATGY